MTNQNSTETARKPSTELKKAKETKNSIHLNPNLNSRPTNKSPILMIAVWKNLPKLQPKTKIKMDSKKIKTRNLLPSSKERFPAVQTPNPTKKERKTFSNPIDFLG